MPKLASAFFCICFSTELYSLEIEEQYKTKVIMDSPEQGNTYCDLWDGTFNAMFHLANVVLGIGFRFVP